MIIKPSDKALDAYYAELRRFQHFGATHVHPRLAERPRLTATHRDRAVIVAAVGRCNFYNPRDMGLVQVHAQLAIAVMLFNLILGLWGFLKFLRGHSMDGNYFGAVALSPILGLAQMALGLILIGQGLGVNVRFVHYLYGALVIISAPAVFAFTRGRDDRGAVLIYAAVLVLTAAFGLRAYTTGLGAAM